MNSNLAKVQEFKNVLNSQTIKAQIKNSLREKSGAFMSSMIDLYNGDKTLQECDATAVAMECVKAASLDLPIIKSLGFAYVVPYKGKPTFTIGYKGLIQLAQRSGQFKTINADAVCEGELKGFDKLSGMIDLSGEKTSNTVVGYFAYFKLLNGYEKSLYMTVEEMRDYADKYSPAYSKNKDKGYSPWYNEFDKMAQKTVLRQLLSKYAPMSTEMQKAVAMDEQPQENKKTTRKANSGEMIDVEPVAENTINVDPATGEVITGNVSESVDALPPIED